MSGVPPVAIEDWMKALYCSGGARRLDDRTPVSSPAASPTAWSCGRPEALVMDELDVGRRRAGAAQARRRQRQDVPGFQRLFIVLPC